jgi:hypothetical protein
MVGELSQRRFNALAVALGADGLAEHPAEVGDQLALVTGHIDDLFRGHGRAGDAQDGSDIEQPLPRPSAHK